MLTLRPLPVGKAPTLLSIQILRAVAALVVALTHLGYEFDHLGQPDLWPKFFGIGNVGVDLFFVISGFVMVYASASLFGRKEAPLQFFFLRLARIVPLYWTTTTIILIYILIHYPSLESVGIGLGTVAASYFFVPYHWLNGFMAPIHGVGWTLNYEMFFYVCFSMALLAARRTGVIVLAFALAGFVMLNCLLPLPKPFYNWADPIILEFVLGMLVALAYQAGVRLPTSAAIGVVVTALLLFVISPLETFSGPYRFFFWGCPAACIVGALVFAHFSFKESLVARALGILGDASYAFYLCHPLTAPVVRRFLPRFVDPATHQWLYAALVLIVSLAVALMVHIALEKPFTRRLQSSIRSRFSVALKDSRPKAAFADVRT